MKSGIYQIQHVESGRRYIGSLMDFMRGPRSHKHALRRVKHANPALQNAWNKYGEAAFSFKILLLYARDTLTFYEDLIIKGYRSNVKPFGYNTREVVESNFGILLGSSMQVVGAKFSR